VFSKITAAIESLKPKLPSFDPQRFGDPMALQIDWSPLARGGSTFRTHTLDGSNPQRWVFKMSHGGLLFCAVFITMGLGIFTASFWQDDNAIVMRLFGAVFAAAGFAMGWAMSAPTVFDRHRGYYCKGRKQPENTFDRSKLINYTQLDRIHALQLIAELVTQSQKNKSKYLSYELNLVLIDGTRLNVIDHGDHARIRADALKLADFLGTPLWDATQA
jgi:hypothetical protein